MTQPLPPSLHLPAALERQLWQHARREWPQECVGVLGGVYLAAEQWQAHTLYPLLNVAADSGREYLAHGPDVLRALGAMRAEKLELVAIYHSHPHGPPMFSRTDQLRAAYDVPHLIADVASGTLSAFLLPEGRVCRLRR
ncbi:Mov34/MPN/PAD-1 family protein [Deinococcus sp.]|uniref:Mov34/MPN/PAD-1 family protein n=1 Tax=Deinococcus sp. TaxID=47478 RepID=UPI003B5A0C24